MALGEDKKKSVLPMYAELTCVNTGTHKYIK